MGERLAVEAEDGLASLFLPPEFVSDPVFWRDPRSQSKLGEEGLLLALVGFWVRE